MAGSAQRAGTVRRRARRVVGGVLTTTTALAAIALAPGTATAATTYIPTGTVAPLLDCVGRNSDGSYTAVLGYANSASAKSIPLGSWNSISPTRYDGSQPTTFKAGTQHGVFSLKLSGSDYTSGGTSWFLDGNMVFIGWAYSQGVPTCTSVQLPAEGNDTGAGIALVAAGVLGAVVVARVRRRALAGEEVRPGA